MKEEEVPAHHREQVTPGDIHEQDAGDERAACSRFKPTPFPT
jgi:hypothetical protein